MACIRPITPVLFVGFGEACPCARSEAPNSVASVRDVNVRMSELLVCSSGLRIARLRQSYGAAGYDSWQMRLAAALALASGARVAASKGTADALIRGDETPDDPQFGFGRAATEFPAVRRVDVVKDGEMLRVGPLSITAHLTPGHTPGSTAWTWKSCEGSRCLDIVYADSLNAISAPGFRYSAAPARVALFRKSIETVASLPCDIVISVHPDLTGFLEKVAAKNFVTPGGCRDYAANATRILDARLASE